MRHRRRLLAVTCAAIAGSIALWGAPAGAADPDTASAAARPTCNGQPATIAGGPGRDVIFGTQARDVIVAGGGNDVVMGRGGNDLVCGGAGSDLMDGGRDTDTLYGGLSRDQCMGESWEHVRHYQCEVHRPPLPRLNRPRQTTDLKAEPVQKVASVPGQAASVAAVPDFYFYADAPFCGSNITFGRFYFSAEFSNPGWFAIRPHFQNFNTGIWYTYADQNYRMVYAPNDDQAYYSGIGGEWTLGSQDAIIGYYEIHWGQQNVDGSVSWDTGQYVPFGNFQYAGVQVSGPVCARRF